MLMSVFFIFSCNALSDEDCEPDVDCYPYPIDSGYVNVKISPADPVNGVEVILYKGYVEDSVILGYYLIYEDEATFYMPVGARYAAEAFYPNGQGVYIVLDGKKLKNDTYMDCGERCYRFPEVDLNLKKL